MILIKKEKFQINGNELIISSSHKEILRIQKQGLDCYTLSILSLSLTLSIIIIIISVINGIQRKKKKQRDGRVVLVMKQCGHVYSCYLYTNFFLFCLFLFLFFLCFVFFILLFVYLFISCRKFLFFFQNLTIVFVNLIKK